LVSTCVKSNGNWDAVFFVQLNVYSCSINGIIRAGTFLWPTVYIFMCMCGRRYWHSHGIFWVHCNWDSVQRRWGIHHGRVPTCSGSDSQSFISHDTRRLATASVCRSCSLLYQECLSCSGLSAVYIVQVSYMNKTAKVTWKVCTECASLSPYHGGIETFILHNVPWAPKSVQPKYDLSPFSRLCTPKPSGATWQTEWQTGTLAARVCISFTQWSLKTIISNVRLSSQLTVN